jgi:hypothetical protein
MLRAVAASTVAIWLALFAIELSESFELIPPVDANQSVKTLMADFSRAIRAVRNMPGSHTLSVRWDIITESPPQSLFMQNHSPRLRKEAEFLKARFKIHKFHLVFLI